MGDNVEKAVDSMLRYEAERRGLLLVEHDGRVCWRHPFKDAYCFRLNFPRTKVVVHMELPRVPAKHLDAVLESLFSTKVEYR